MKFCSIHFLITNYRYTRNIKRGLGGENLKKQNPFGTGLKLRFTTSKILVFSPFCSRYYLPDSLGTFIGNRERVRLKTVLNTGEKPPSSRKQAVIHQFFSLGFSSKLVINTRGKPVLPRNISTRA